ncbi:hypothetical protein TUM4261_09030 [Shewanella sp. c952]|uniref:hypothetical protein n=1 Tax=Shewanella sp. c952 TaxID=2815913 RepID=UPI001BBD8D53|nr:hypothetical protein [Shewanella sp. c952]GIU06114.1 hypothetical protein TUM4261_09030 [Shewanella sp. c952]
MKASTWFLILIAGSFTGCYGDRILSNLLFDKYCSEEGRTGQFIYERVGLGEEYFIPIPKNRRELVRVDRGYFIDNDKLLIDEKRFLKDFVYSDTREILISQFGPIYSYENTVVRKSDNKVLSKKIFLVNEKGWLFRQSILWVAVGDHCPEYRGNLVVKSESKTFYKDLIDNTFYKK